MKKFQSLGRSLSKEEQKAIAGGKVHTVACSCMVNGQVADTFVCNWSDVGGVIRCNVAAIQYCNSTYGTGDLYCAE